MYCNSIIRKTSELKSTKNVAKDMPYIYDVILYYGNNNVVNKPYINKDYLFTQSDEYGDYYSSYGGGRDNYKCEDRNKIRNNKKVIGIKFYKHEKKFGISNIWDDVQTKKCTYPTQKPSKLLERIILLSTV